MIDNPADNPNTIRLERIKREWLDIVGQEPTTLDELAQGVISVLNHQPTYNYRRDITQENVKVLGLKWNLVWSPRVSNTHDCPIYGVTNWSRAKHLPPGYPGWAGRVWVRYEKNIGTFASTPWTQTLTYVGSGGAGGYDGPWEKLSDARWKIDKDRKKWPKLEIFSWDFRFYQDDWPILCQAAENSRLINKLQNDCDAVSDDLNRHEFFWQDPKALADDQRFMDYYYKKSARCSSMERVAAS